VQQANDGLLYLSVKKRTSSGKMAHVSTTRKLVRMLFYHNMLKTRQHWKWENPKLSEKKRLQGLEVIPTSSGHTGIEQQAEPLYMQHEPSSSRF
jgi:hypothetical protein